MIIWRLRDGLSLFSTEFFSGSAANSKDTDSNSLCRNSLEKTLCPRIVSINTVLIHPENAFGLNLKTSILQRDRK